MKSKKLKCGSLVKVVWIGSAGATSHWEWFEDYELKTYRMRTIGYVWATSKQNISIAPHVSEGMKQGCGIMVIPWCSIKKVKCL